MDGELFYLFIHFYFKFYIYADKKSFKNLTCSIKSFLWFGFKLQSLPSGSVVKNLPSSARGGRDMGSVPGSRRSPEVIKATHSYILAWKIPLREGAWESQRVGDDWVTEYIYTHYWDAWFSFIPVAHILFCIIL